LLDLIANKQLFNNQHKEVEMGFPKKLSTINIVVVSGLSLEDKPENIKDDSFLCYLAGFLQDCLKTSGNINCSVDAENKIIFSNVPLSLNNEDTSKNENIDEVLKNFVKRISGELDKLLEIEFRCQALKYHKNILGAPLKLVKDVEGFGK
jgi:hypothetical protein